MKTSSFYKKPELSFEQQSVSSLISSIENERNQTDYISAEDLPTFLDFLGIYQCFEQSCVQFVNSISMLCYNEANLALSQMGKYLLDHEVQLSSNNIDFTKLTNIFIRTNFFNALYSGVTNQIEEIIPNCAYFIAGLTRASNTFGLLLSEKDFVRPLLEHILYNEFLTSDQSWYIFVSVNNLLEFYPKIDPTFSAIFDLNIIEIIDTLIKKRGIQFQYVALFVYALVKYARDIEVYYPAFISFFTGTEIVSGFTFRYVIRALYFMIKNSPIYAKMMLVNQNSRLLLVDLYQYYVINQDECGDEVSAYTRLVIEILRNYDFNFNHEGNENNPFNIPPIVNSIERNEFNKIDIFKILNIEEIMDMLVSPNGNGHENQYAMQFIETLIDKKLFFLLENFDINHLIRTIVDIFYDSPMSERMQSFILLYKLMTDNFEQNSPIILNSLIDDISPLDDMLESESPKLQEMVLKFLSFVFTKLDNQGKDEPNEFIVALMDNMECLTVQLQKIIETTDQKSDTLVFLASVILRKVEFWKDIPYQSTNCLNDNYD